jgi:hypothetical protein
MAELSNENNLTTHASYIPEIWPGMVIEFRDKNLVMADLVDRRDIDVSNYGDTFHYPITTAGTAQTYAAGYRLSDSLQVDTDNDVDLSIDQFKMHPFHIPWNVKDQVKYDTMALNMRQAGEAVARAIDTKVHEIIVNGATLDEQNEPAATAQVDDLEVGDITGAFTVMNVADVPASDRAWVFHPTAYNELLNLSSNYFISHDFVTGSPMETGKIGMMLGSPVYMSTNVETDSDGSPAETSYKNLYFHKDCAALAMQRQPEVEQAYDIDTQGWFGNVRAGYGSVMLRGDHAVLINTVND